MVVPLYSENTKKKGGVCPGWRKGENGKPRGYVDISDLCRLFGRRRATIYVMMVDERLPQATER